MPHPIIDHLRRHRLAVAGLVVVGGLAATTFALAGRGAPPPRPAMGPELAIAIVPPVEPDIQPGEVMDVGDLNDGFDRASLRRTAPPLLLDAPLAHDQTAWVEPPPPAPRRVSSSPTRDRNVDPGYDRPVPPPPPRDQYEGNPRAFGFDARRPDYEAERAQRRAMMEARLDERIRERFEAERREAERQGRPRPPRERYDSPTPPPPWQARRPDPRPYDSAPPPWQSRRPEPAPYRY